MDPLIRIATDLAPPTAGARRQRLTDDRRPADRRRRRRDGGRLHGALAVACDAAAGEREDHDQGEKDESGRLDAKAASPVRAVQALAAGSAGVGHRRFLRPGVPLRRRLTRLTSWRSGKTDTPKRGISVVRSALRAARPRLRTKFIGTVAASAMVSPSMFAAERKRRDGRHASGRNLFIVGAAKSRYRRRCTATWTYAASEIDVFVVGHLRAARTSTVRPARQLAHPRLLGVIGGAFFGDVMASDAQCARHSSPRP